MAYEQSKCFTQPTKSVNNENMVNSESEVCLSATQGNFYPSLVYEKSFKRKTDLFRICFIHN